MKNIMTRITSIVLLMIAFSCADNTLDPLQFDFVGKGAILALRGEQLDNIYFNALPGAQFNPRAIDGTESFDFDAEYLAVDPSTLESFDIYVIKKPSLERIHIKNVPASEFKETDDYRNPWVSVSIPLQDILDALELDPVNNPADVETLLDVYEFGIPIESDLNLTDGTKVPAANLVASGLYQSNQFYPAQKLNYSVLNYCPEDLAGTYSFNTVVTAVGAGGSLAGCAGGVSGDGELVAIALGIYTISDISFGQYDCAWNDDPATGGTLVNACDKLSFGGADQYDLVYTITNANVTPDGTQLSFNWENDYGDKGTTVLTRTDAKLWPTTLYSD